MCLLDRGRGHVHVVPAMRNPEGMALFGMVWLLRVRSEMKRCAKCRRQEVAAHAAAVAEERASASTFFTIDTAVQCASSAGGDATAPVSPGHALAPTTYCEVHGYNPPKEDIQEFYELTLLDDSKSVQEKTAETIRIANKWETNDGPIAPPYNNECIAFAAVLAVAQAGLLPAYSAPAYAQVAKAYVAQPEPYDPNPQYQFGYGVDDHITGDSKSQQEHRSGDVVQGSYSLTDADGFRRTVEYTADPIHGFNAVVHREPLGVKTITKVAAPVAYAAPIAKYAAAPVAYAAPIAHAGHYGYAAPVAKVASYAAPAYYHH